MASKNNKERINLTDLGSYLEQEYPHLSGSGFHVASCILNGMLEAIKEGNDLEFRGLGTFRQPRISYRADGAKRKARLVFRPSSTLTKTLNP